MADFDWTWPAKIERDVIERALTLDFLPEERPLTSRYSTLHNALCGAE